MVMVMRMKRMLLYMDMDEDEKDWIEKIAKLIMTCYDEEK